MFDWTFVTHYAPFFVNGAAMTLFISVFGIVLSIVVGLICAGIEIARIPVLKQIVRVYIELSRNTPLLVQLYFLYFGLPKLGVVWSAEQCAIVGLGFLGGSYMAEAMRGGLETIPNVQRESAYVLGLSQWQTLSRVVIPQAIGTSIPRHCGQRDLPDQGIIRRVGHRARRRDVHGQGSDRHVLQHVRIVADAGRRVLGDSAADFIVRHLAGTEVRL